MTWLTSNDRRAGSGRRALFLSLLFAVICALGAADIAQAQVCAPNAERRCRLEGGSWNDKLCQCAGSLGLQCNATERQRAGCDAGRNAAWSEARCECVRCGRGMRPNTATGRCDPAISSGGGGRVCPPEPCRQGATWDSTRCRCTISPDAVPMEPTIPDRPLPGGGVGPRPSPLK